VCPSRLTQTEAPSVGRCVSARRAMHVRYARTKQGARHGLLDERCSFVKTKQAVGGGAMLSLFGGNVEIIVPSLPVVIAPTPPNGQPPWLFRTSQRPQFRLPLTRIPTLSTL
jgi:hypothetical protein